MSMATDYVECPLWLNVVTSEIPEDIRRSVDDGRVILVMSPADREKFDAMPRESRKRVTITDLTTDTRWQVWRTSCGLGCRCAAGGRMLP